MKGTGLGAFEELVLLTVGSLPDEAYGVRVAEELGRHTGRNVSLSPVHTALYRLEKKGFARSEMGGATNTRGGRRKRLYHLTSTGRQALEQIWMVRNNLWKLLPDV